MPKHKLYSSNLNSPALNSSIDKGKSPRAEFAKTLSNKLEILAAKAGAEEECSKKKQKNSEEEKANSSLSDSMDESDFFAQESRPKAPYTMEEDELILKFVLKGQNISKVSSISLWKQLEAKKENPKRTYQSLKNRFIRNIKPYLFSRYSQLITDENTVNKILEKFPELRKQVGRRDTLPGLKLPKRNPTHLKTPEQNNVSSTSVSEAAVFVREEPQVHEKVPEAESTTSNLRRNHPQKENVYRIVKLKNNSVTVTVHCDNIEAHPKLSSQSTGIYESYLKHKKKNVLVPCSMCGRCGNPERNEGGSDSESDVIIANSVGSSNKTPSQNSSKNIQKENHTLALSPAKRAVKRRKNNPSSKTEPTDLSPCSPSLLNDISEVEEISRNSAQDERPNNVEAARVEDAQEAPNIEPDSQSSNLSKGILTEKDLESLYQETIAQGQRLMDSDEEEILVHKCLRKNCGEFGFQKDLSISQNNVESFFLRSNSPSLDNITESPVESSSENSKTPSAQTPLAQNMVKMLQEGTQKN